ncbi:alpha/beta hydrolase [Nocardioides sp. GXQ0305]|uniref:alpha/beta hydrolase n=1 Tax=Nocardioides sp. GXQ0305 TaxID=3423912 RepID=UPI003D7D413B
MPSRRHQLLAYAVPRVRRSRDLVDEPTERARVERWHLGLDRALPTQLVPGFDRRFSLVTEEVAGFPVHVVTPRGIEPRRTLFHVHGGAYMAPIDPFHVRYATRLARALGARVVMPDYPLAPEHTWRDSFGPMTGLAARWCRASRTTLLGDSSGGGYALALAMALRDRGGPQPSELLLLSPWVDLTTSTPATPAYAARDPWLFLGKLHAYALWWAGSEADLGRPEVSPALADLTGLPRALMFCGTRDLLLPGCRLLAQRARAAGWDLGYVEQPDLIHSYPLLPIAPEARTARRQTLEFLR